MSEETQTPTEVSAKDKVAQLFGAYTENLTKFENKGTALAAARARKNLSLLIKEARKARKEIQVAKVAKVAEKRAAKAAAKASTPAA